MGEIANSPEICDGQRESAIVMVGHSMGGIVIKKALILAKQDPNHAALHHRFHSMFFLGTPHHGADGAALLKKLVSIFGQKAYMDDLRPGSTNTQVINDEFRNVYGTTQLYSFFETVPMSHLGLIVDSESAKIGLPGERIQLLNADHRHVCKFADRNDSNYLSVRNALASVVEGIEKTWHSGRRNEYSLQMLALSKYLDIVEKPVANLSSINQKQTDGTCSWLDNNANYRSWVQLKSPERLFYLEGEPASGKSTVAGHVIRTLEQTGMQCVYFFFKHSDSTQSTAATLLRSLAWQMAALNGNVRSELLQMAEHEHFVDLRDEGSVWRGIFVSRILRIRWNHPCFWVIDALDECSNHATLFPLISKIEEHHPLRIFMTCRPLLAIDRLFGKERLARLSQSISITDSLFDIKMFLTANREFLPAEDDREREMLLNRILNRSNGNFLWTSLVLQELSETPSVQQAYEVLDSVPNGMDDLYSRILESLMANQRNLNLAMAILKWVVCALRPMYIDELKGALDHDLSMTLPRLEQTLSSLTGNLALVDSSGRVQLVHQTFRAFLTSDSTVSEAVERFRVVRERDHLHISSVCLEYLNGPELRTPRHRRGSTTSRPAKRSPFLAYAASHFSDHVVRSCPEDDSIVKALQFFLKGNCLTWIEIMAQKGDLLPIARAASNFRAFLKKRARTLPPIGQPVEDLRSWASDLGRLVSSFGKALMMSPASIHFLIPAVCPPLSAIHRAFGQYPRPLRIFGSTDSDWDDRVSCVVYANLQALAVASRDDYTAIGLSDGTARVLSLSTTKEQSSLKHGEHVRRIRFSADSSRLLTISRKRICIWDLQTGKTQWQKLLGSPILCADFTADNMSVMTMTQANVVSIWTASDGELTHEFNIFDIDEETGQQHPTRRMATQADYCPGLSLLAVSYRQRPIVIWELIGDDIDYIGSFTKNSSSFPGPLMLALAFNPKPELALCAASYDDGDLVVFDPYTQLPRRAIVESVARMHGSNDGTMLVVGNGMRRVSLLEFETLHKVYCIDSHDMAVKDFAFSSDSEIVLEVRGNHCNVWQPPALSRATDPSDMMSVSFDEEHSQSAATIALNLGDHSQHTTAMFAPRQSSMAYCGREDGSIGAYSTADGLILAELLDEMGNVPIAFLGGTSAGTFIVSIDVSGRCRCLTYDKETNQSKELGYTRVFGIVQQMLVQENGSALLISLEDRDEVLGLPSLDLIRDLSHQGRRPAKWARHPLQSTQLICVTPLTIECYDWETLSRTSGHIEVQASIAPNSVAGLVILTNPRSKRFAVVRSPSFADKEQHAVLEIHDLSALDSTNPSIRPVASYIEFSRDIKQLIALTETSLVFLTHQGWVCSLAVASGMQQTSYVRHFYVPFRYHNTGRPVLAAMNNADVVIFGYEAGIVAFENGLTFAETVQLSPTLGTAGAADGGALGKRAMRLSMRSTLQRGSSAPTT